MSTSPLSCYARPLVAIVDPHDSGHHAMYAAGYQQALLRSGCDVMAIAPRSLLNALPEVPLGGPSVRKVTWDVLERLALKESPEDRATMLWQDLGYTLAAEAAATGRSPCVVLLLYLDSFISELLKPEVASRTVSCPVVGLWFKPPVSLRLRWRERIRRLLRFGRRFRLFRSPRFAALLLLDPEAAGSIRGRAVRVVTVPEFTDTSLPASRPPLVEEMLARAGGRRICSLVGSIDGRKGLSGLLEAVAAAPGEQWFFVIVGKVAWHTFPTDVRRLLSDPSGAVLRNLMLVDEWCETDTLNAIIAESDLLYACYENWPYSSNMLCKAAAFGTPVLARDEGYIGRNVRRFALGVLLSPWDSIAKRFDAGFGEAVDAIAADSTFKSGCRKYLAANDLDALVAALRPLIEDLQCG